MQHVFNLGKLPLTLEANQTAILACGSHFKAPYELYAYKKVALAATGLTQTQVDRVGDGEEPNDLDARCSAAFNAALIVSKTPGLLLLHTWDACVNHLGREETVALVTALASVPTLV